ncbi:family 16 glycosylhydrolase [Hymenobacter sp. IS2118]|uniref:glycoside hydrolase family 16 protein n=1 Tax=Hymenobacter sp. IS2118 TaxID=1505605 RepID=UPI00055819B0|nr:glycoside hydrolase family 16 protein [Hymenobacter sp. IS2118]
MQIQSINVFRSYQLGASLLLALGLTACTEKPSTPPVTPPPVVPVVPVVNEGAKDYADYNTLVWSDEFDGSSLDQSKWGYDLGGGGWGNNEKQNYTNSGDNSFVSGGNLTIQARRQQLGSNAYTSARLLTKGKKTFVFGRIDTRAKVPKGKGVWPAIWMLGADIDQNNWPKCGEIDIMELRGSRPKELLATMHFPDANGNRLLKGTTNTLPVDLSEDFHIYSVVRSKDQIRMYIDGVQYFTFGPGDTAGNYPFNNPFFMILNVAVGGDFDGDPDASTVFPQQMQVDYVRHYQYK